MTLISIIVIYIIFLSLLVVVNYYINLLTSKEEYTRDELKSIFPHFNELWQVFQSKFTLLYLLIFLIISSIIGISIPLASNNWFINSSILFIIVFLLFPYLKNFFEKKKVTASEDYLDNFANTFAKHTEIITIGFGIGLGTSLIFVWGSTRELSFIWFLINISIIFVLMQITLRNILSK